MIRIRVPGGQTTGAALATLGEVADTWGSGLLQLTSRGSMQMRGLPETVPPEAIQGLTDAGLLPSADHDRVRNILASPLTGLSGGLADLRPMISALDQAIIDRSALAQLPGRFLFVLDDGRGDLAEQPVDLGYRALDAEQGIILVGDSALPAPMASRDVVPTLIALAEIFLARSGVDTWHIRDLDCPFIEGLVSAPVSSSAAPHWGVVGDHVNVAVPLGLLTPEQRSAVIEASGGGRIVLTPWRGLIILDAADRLPELITSGLITDPGSAWTMISACVGAPWCSKGRADTRALATKLAAIASAGLPRVHLSGCERRCGAPKAEHRDLVAPTRADLAEVSRG